MLAAESRYDYEVAAIAAMRYSEFVGVRTAEGAAVLMTRALAYATLRKS
jgi:hypothetical protein